MAKRQFTTAEKGKNLMMPSDSNIRRIRAPVIDTSALIRENALTIIGRVVNPKEQPISALLAALPRQWTLRGGVTGADLGLHCFQFRFELEEDLLKVLEQRPFQYNHWMVILQRWEPIISPLFPSQIPFWIRLQGIPLHFWHQDMIYNIAHDLGRLEDYKITNTSARVRILVDGLKPLTKQSLLEFDSGEEVMISMDYEDLGYHCSNCNMLSHLSRSCPHLEPSTHAGPTTQLSSTHIAERNRDARQPYERPAQTQTTRGLSDSSFRSRVDRHGRPFGDRLQPAASRGQPLTNKIVPKEHSLDPPVRNDRQHLTGKAVLPRPNDYRSRDISPLHRTNHQRRSTTPNTHRDAHAQEQNSSSHQAGLPFEIEARPPLGRNLELCDFPAAAAAIPTKETVLNELREASYQYINCGDPVESEARRQRVLETEMNGLVEETANGIVASAQQAAITHAANPAPGFGITGTSTPTGRHEPTVAIADSLGALQTPAFPKRPRGHHGSSRKQAPNSKTLPGASSRRRLLSRAGHPYSRHGFPHASPVLPIPHSRQRTTSSEVPPPPPARSSSRRSSSDFRSPHHHLP